MIGKLDHFEGGRSLPGTAPASSWWIVIGLVLGGCAEASSPSRLDAGPKDGTAAARDGGADAGDGAAGAVTRDDGGGGEGPATDAQLMAFRTALNRWGGGHASLPADVDAMVASVPVVVVGVLGTPGPGRRLYAGPGTFDSYANLQIRGVEVLKGTLPQPMEPVHAELPWPNNVDVSELVDSAPIGARAIVLGADVPEALREAQMLEGEGIAAIETVKPNLLAIPPYGLLVESVDGETHAPMWELGSQGPLVEEGSDTLTVFEDALTAIRAAAR